MIVATPLDLPKIEPDDWEIFWKIWERESKNAIKIKKNLQNSVALVGRSNLWQGLDIYKNYNLVPAWDVPYYDISKELPILYQQILNLPFKYIYCVRILKSLTDIKPHSDDSKDWWSVRALWHCDDKESQWYFTHPKINAKEKTFFYLPKNTNWFSYNDRYCWHGTIFRKDHPKFLLQIYMLDNPTDLINRSIERYKDFTIDIT
jgi:hypothetical protein